MQLQITDVAFGGKGVARANGKAVFVPYVIDEETISASITREHKKFLEADLENIVTASPHRIEPRTIKRRPKQYPWMSAPRPVLRKRLIHKAHAA